ncbi:MAG: hypothetical protein IBX67_03830 [Dehalococcoidia bacterium]|nr:hypothetical protein [Dehalococcoidia bacterium]
MGKALSKRESLVSTLPAMIQALVEPGAYTHQPSEIELTQTQMSFVFLAGDFVYKVKKGVNLGYLDYSTLEKRRFFCHQELELNRRLCPAVYLAVVPISEEQGVFRIEGTGEAVEYAVKMKRLPPERMMDVLLPQSQVTGEMIARVAEKLTGFHRQAATGPQIAAFGSLEVVGRNTDENFAQTEKYMGTSITPGQYENIKGYTGNFMNCNTGLFDARVREHRIRDCHGDLHAAHVCFTDDICIYDCIEFNDRFRYCDVASELAFLAMDLDRYERVDLSRQFVDTYVKLSQDNELLKLLQFYKCYRAYVRGKVESFKLDDSYIPEEEKTRVLAVAQGYFKLAESYALSAG